MLSHQVVGGEVFPHADYEKIAVLKKQNEALKAELTLHDHRIEARRNEGEPGLPQGDCSCVICAPFYKRLATAEADRMEMLRKLVNEQEEAKLRVADIRKLEADLQKLQEDKELLDWADAHMPVDQNDYRTMRNALKSAQALTKAQQ